MMFDSDRLAYPIKRQINEREYQLRRVFTVRVGGWVSVILPGFTWDGFSVPRLFWAFQPPFAGPATVAALDHDAKYAKMWDGGRRQADRHFRALMRQYGEGRVRAYIMYRAVRDFGWIAWRKTDAEIEAASRLVRILPDSAIAQIETTVRRGEIMGELLDRRDRLTCKTRIDVIDREMVSIAAGEIDKQIERAI